MVFGACGVCCWGWEGGVGGCEWEKGDGLEGGGIGGVVFVM